jgi:hypothetical protein
MRIRFAPLAGFLLLAGCMPEMNRKASKWMPLASSLTKLTAAVESTVSFKKNAPPGSRDQELVRVATAHDPSLLEPFTDHAIRAEDRNGHAAVMICTKDGARALFEDVGCTAQVDKHHWASNATCEFTLDVVEACR